MKTLDTIILILFYGVLCVFLLLAIILAIRIGYIEKRNERRNSKLIRNILDRDLYQQGILENIERLIDQRRHGYEQERINSVRNKLNNFKFLKNDIR